MCMCALPRTACHAHNCLIKRELATALRRGGAARLLRGPPVSAIGQPAACSAPRYEKFIDSYRGGSGLYYLCNNYYTLTTPRRDRSATYIHTLRPLAPKSIHASNERHTINNNALIINNTLLIINPNNNNNNLIIQRQDDCCGSMQVVPPHLLFQGARDGGGFTVSTLVSSPRKVFNFAHLKGALF